MSNDSRRDLRTPISLKVRFKSATVDEFVEQYSMNLSRGGIFIQSKHPLPVGTLIKFEFQLKDESRLIHGVGRVVWKRSISEAESGGMPPGMGIKFIKMDPESKRVVEHIVSETSKFGKPSRGDAGYNYTSTPEQPGGETSTKATAPFFPDDLPPAPPVRPEDRTVVRHASEFLASALAQSGGETADEAARKAEEARLRTEEINRQRRAANAAMPPAPPGAELRRRPGAPPPPPPPAASVGEPDYPADEANTQVVGTEPTEPRIRFDVPASSHPTARPPETPMPHVREGDEVDDDLGGAVDEAVGELYDAAIAGGYNDSAVTRLPSDAPPPSPGDFAEIPTRVNAKKKTSGPPTRNYTRSFGSPFSPGEASGREKDNTDNLAELGNAAPRSQRPPTRDDDSRDELDEREPTPPPERPRLKTGEHGLGSGAHDRPRTKTGENPAISGLHDRPRTRTGESTVLTPAREETPPQKGTWLGLVLVTLVCISAGVAFALRDRLSTYLGLDSGVDTLEAPGVGEPQATAANEPLAPQAAPSDAAAPSAEPPAGNGTPSAPDLNLENDTAAANTATAVADAQPTKPNEAPAVPAKPEGAAAAAPAPSAPVASPPTAGAAPAAAPSSAANAPYMLSVTSEPPDAIVLLGNKRRLAPATIKLDSVTFPVTISVARQGFRTERIVLEANQFIAQGGIMQHELKVVLRPRREGTPAAPGAASKEPAQPGAAADAAPAPQAPAAEKPAEKPSEKPAEKPPEKPADKAPSPKPDAAGGPGIVTDNPFD